MRARPRLVVALDVDSGQDAVSLVDTLAGRVDVFKVGSRLFTAAGPAVVGQIRQRGASVFLDLKFHDIPATVGGAVRAAGEMGVAMLTVHACGGLDMMRAAVEAAKETSMRMGVERSLVVGVTVLTSLAADDLTVVAAMAGGVEDLVLRLAGRAREAGLDGVVASVEEASLIKERIGTDFVVVTPGIRPPGTEAGDQKRIATPQRAAAAGADYIVVGRPVVGASSPLQAVEAILADLGKV